MQKLGFYNTPWAIILPGGVSIWYIILIRSYYRTIGESLREAAMIDGASHYQIYFNLFLPNSKAIIAVIALYTIIGQWNSWFQALIYLPNTYWAAASVVPPSTAHPAECVFGVCHEPFG